MTFLALFLSKMALLQTWVDLILLSQVIEEYLK